MLCSQRALPLQKMKVDGAVAVVTGAARGIGLAIARTLLMNGARVSWVLCIFCVFKQYVLIENPVLITIMWI